MSIITSINGTHFSTATSFTSGLQGKSDADASSIVLKFERDRYFPSGNHPISGQLRSIQGSVRAYQVVATFEIGMYDYDNTFIFMPLKAAQIFFRMKSKVTALEVITDDPDEGLAFRGLIGKAIGGGFRLFDWQQANASFFNAIQVERNVMFLILTLIIVVAAFNIISSMIMLVKDKSGDIAILRTT